MQPEMNTSLQERTYGALEGATTLELAELDPSALLVVMTAVGDALRLGIEIPAELRRKLDRSVSEAHILRAIDALTESVGRWSLPQHPLAAEPDHGLEWAVRRRDESESVIVAARRMLLPRGILVDASDNAHALEAAISKHEFGCGGRVSREAAEEMLGERNVLLDGRTWLDDVAWGPDEVAHAPDDEVVIPAGIVRPSIELLAAYVVEGRLRKWIEAEAAASNELAEELSEMIATYRAAGGPVSFVARKWQAANSADSAGVIRFGGAGAVTKKAAASGGARLEDPKVQYELGVLDPLDAQASLAVTAQEVRLTVFAGKLALSSVELDGAFADPPARGGTWTVALPRPPSERPLVVRVKAEPGRSFEATIAVGSDA